MGSSPLNYKLGRDLQVGDHILLGGDRVRIESLVVLDEEVEGEIRPTKTRMAWLGDGTTCPIGPDDRIELAGDQGWQCTSCGQAVIADGTGAIRELQDGGGELHACGEEA